MTQMTFDPLADAIEWADRNPSAYQQFRIWAERDRRQGSRPSIALYVEIARRPHFAHALGLQSTSEYLINNNLRANIARLLNRQYNCGFPTRDARADHWRV